MFHLWWCQIFRACGFTLKQYLPVSQKSADFPYTKKTLFMTLPKMLLRQLQVPPSQVLLIFSGTH